ncbi:Actin-related protein 2/3 complex subunit 2, partial [Penicillium argentinense]
TKLITGGGSDLSGSPTAHDDRAACPQLPTSQHPSPHCVPIMLLLDYQNVLIQSLLTERFSSATPASIDQVVSDFDGVTFHLSTPESKTKILISINVKCFKELVQYGAQAVLEREYGPYIVTPEPGYDFSVQVDLENLPAEQEARDELVMKLALLKRNAMAAPFERAFDEFTKLAEEASRYTSESAPQGVKEGGDVMAIHYREEEAIYIKASWDRVTVIFSTVFREETDRIFGKVFLQEFVDARRRVVTLQNAPQVLFRSDPPLELEGVPGLKNTGEGEISYVTFGKRPEQSKSFSISLCRNTDMAPLIVLFPRHLTPQRRYENISHIQTFRDYFHYHIKASKAYIHTRMRKRTADFLQVLNRARPENEERERKTASGRTFRVQS